MNTFLKSLVAILAIAFPAAFTAEMFGVSLPAAFNTAHAFGAFVMALTVLTLLADYGPTKSLVSVGDTSSSGVAASRSRSRLPLAA